MTRLRTVFVFLMLLLPPYSNAQEVCLSDSELKDVLAGVFIYGTGQGLGICQRRYPDLSPLVQKASHKFAETYKVQMNAVDKATTAVFERLYSGHGKVMRDQNDVAANQQAAETVGGYSLEECKSYIKGVEAMAVADNWKLATGTVAALTYKQERARIPRCK